MAFLAPNKGVARGVTRRVVVQHRMPSVGELQRDVRPDVGSFGILMADCSDFRRTLASKHPKSELDGVDADGEKRCGTVLGGVAAWRLNLRCAKD